MMFSTIKEEWRAVWCDEGVTLIVVFALFIYGISYSLGYGGEVLNEVNRPANREGRDRRDRRDNRGGDRRQARGNGERRENRGERRAPRQGGTK